MISTLIYVGSVFNVRLCSKISLCWVNTHIGVIFFPSSIKVLFLEISGFFLSILIHKLYKIDAFFSLIFVSKCRQSYEFNFKRLYWNKIFHIAVQHDASSVERASFLFTEGPSKAPIKEFFFIVLLQGQHAAASLDWQLESSNVLWHKRRQAERKLAFVLASELLNLMPVFSFIKTWTVLTKKHN